MNACTSRNRFHFAAAADFSTHLRSVDYTPTIWRRDNAYLSDKQREFAEDLSSHMRTRVVERKNTEVAMSLRHVNQSISFSCLTIPRRH